jgi:hypothetical protein
VIGSAPTGNFDRYAPTFDVAAQSFVVVGAAPAAAPAAAPKR